MVNMCSILLEGDNKTMPVATEPGVQGLGFRVKGLGFRVNGSGFRI